jgi:anti-sigma factor RsiW
MDCTQTRGYLQCHVDQELDPVTTQAIDEHLHACSACRKAFRQLDSLRSLIVEGAPYHRAPHSLREKIRAQLNATPVAPRARISVPLGRWLQLGATVAATAAVTWLLTSQLQAPSQDELVVKQVIAGHARSVLTTRLADVASSDQHTVKPWLSSRLDFSPPVVDLTTAGFPLVGGRVDYLDDRPVAVLVYRHRQHLIELFIWPDRSSSQPAAVRTFSRQGYQLQRWTDEGMTFWAISDLNSAEIKTFVERYANRK